MGRRPGYTQTGRRQHITQHTAQIRLAAHTSFLGGQEYRVSRHQSQRKLFVSQPPIYDFEL